MDTDSALAILEDAVARCQSEDMHTIEVFAALHYLAGRMAVKWPIDQFRQGLDNGDSHKRAKMLSDSLAAIKLILQIQNK